jgi:hypothetical protein
MSKAKGWSILGSWRVVIVRITRHVSLTPSSAVRPARFVMAEARQIESGCSAGVLERVFDVQRASILASTTRPRCKRAVVVLSHPGFPAVVLREPQANRLGRLLVSHVRSYCK